VKVGGANDSS
jgi:translation initiation factor 2A